MLKEKLKNKKVVIGLAVAIIVVLLAMVGVVAHNNSPAVRLKKQLSLGDKYLAELNYDDAIAAYEAAILIYPKAESAYVGIAKAYMGKEDYEKALDAVNRGATAVGETESLMALREQIADYYETQGDKYMSEQKYTDAAAAYSAVLGIRKGAEEPYIGLANAYIGTGSYSEALDTVDEGIKDVGETPKLTELKSHIEELINPPVEEEPEPEEEPEVEENTEEDETEEEVENNDTEEDTETQANNENTDADAAQTPAEETVQEQTVETPVAQAAGGGQIALADGTVVSSGGTIPVSQLASATYVMEGSLWLATLMDSVPNSYSADPEGVWAFDGNFAAGTVVPIGQFASWAIGDPYYTYMTIVTATDINNEATYREKSFRIAR